MTYVPKYILCKDEDDKIKQRESFMQWSSGKDYGTKFLTQKEMDEQGIIFDGHNDYYQPLKEDFAGELMKVEHKKITINSEPDHQPPIKISRRERRKAKKKIRYK